MKEFRGKLGNYKIIITEDQTETIWSEYFDENCHNTSGAKEETIYNYIEGCEIEKLSSLHSPLNVLDVGFGPGLGLYYLAEKISPNISVNYYSIELDPELVYWAIKNTFKEIPFQRKQKRIDENSELEFITFTYKNITATIFIGDGRKTIPQAFHNGLIENIHAIFQDPFSPKKNPTLWTVEWFKDLIKLSHPNVRLSTYSSSVSIRKSLLEAGFQISNHKGFGHKKTMTRANLFDPTPLELLKELERSPTSSLHDS